MEEVNEIVDNSVSNKLKIGVEGDGFKEESAAIAYIIDFPCKSDVKMTGKEASKENSDEGNVKGEEQKLTSVSPDDDIIFTDLDNGTVTKISSQNETCKIEVKLEDVDSGVGCEEPRLLGFLEDIKVQEIGIVLPSIPTDFQTIQTELLNGLNSKEGDVESPKSFADETQMPSAKIKSYQSKIKWKTSEKSESDSKLIKQKIIEKANSMFQTAVAKPIDATNPKSIRTYGKRKIPIKDIPSPQKNKITVSEVSIVPATRLILPQRKLIIDSQKQISNNDFRRQLAETKDILSQRPKSIFSQTKSQPKDLSVGDYFSLPGRSVPNVPLSKLYSNKLILKYECERKEVVKQIVPLDPSDLRVPTNSGTNSSEKLVHVGKLPGKDVEKTFKIFYKAPVWKETKTISPSTSLAEEKHVQTPTPAKTYSRKKVGLQKQKKEDSSNTNTNKLDDKEEGFALDHSNKTDTITPKLNSQEGSDINEKVDPNSKIKNIPKIVLSNSVEGNTNENPGPSQNSISDTVSDIPAIQVKVEINSDVIDAKQDSNQNSKCF